MEKGTPRAEIPDPKARAPSRPKAGALGMCTDTRFRLNSVRKRFGNYA